MIDLAAHCDGSQAWNTSHALPMPGSRCYDLLALHSGQRLGAGVRATLLCFPLPHRYAEAVLSESSL
jgi:hypothetical protein